MRRSLLLLVAAASLPLGGCLAGLAAGAVGAAVQAASPNRGPVAYSADLVAAARAACAERAAQHGQVHIIDAEQGRGGRVRVWGTVQGPAERRSFICTWNREVSGFTLRAIPAR